MALFRAVGRSVDGDQAASAKKNQPAARRVDDRRVISDILQVLKLGFRGGD